MSEFKYAGYFEKDVLTKRPYLKKKWCEQMVSEEKFKDVLSDGRVRFWGQIEEFDNK